MATGNTLEAVAAVYLTVRNANGRRLFEDAQDFFKFVGLSISFPVTLVKIGTSHASRGNRKGCSGTTMLGSRSHVPPSRE
jgi:hypothetical protein